MSLRSRLHIRQLNHFSERTCVTIISGDPSLEAFLLDLRVVQTQAWHLHTPLRPGHIGSCSCRSLQHTKRGQTIAIFVHYYLDFYHSTMKFDRIVDYL